MNTSILVKARRYQVVKSISKPFRGAWLLWDCRTWGGVAMSSSLQCGHQEEGTRQEESSVGHVRNIKAIIRVLGLFTGCFNAKNEMSSKNTNALTYLVKHTENIALVDEILVNEKKDSISSQSRPNCWPRCARPALLATRSGRTPSGWKEAPSYLGFLKRWRYSRTTAGEKSITIMVIWQGWS